MHHMVHVALSLAMLAMIAGESHADRPLPTVPAGFEVKIAAEFPVVERPVMACFDNQGRLYLVDSAGVNEPFTKLVLNPQHRIVVIEDTDHDGKFDKRTVFADKLVMPQGVLPYQGAVYTASPPSVWKLEDTNGDGICDKRTEIVTEFYSNGNGADIHGPFLGPDGWLYLCDGRHGHKVRREDGTMDQGLAGGIFRFRPDGTRFERVSGGGFDNPVEIDFTDWGEILGTVNILHGNPRQDCLVHWMEGGVYPRADQEQSLAESKRTGDLLPPIKELGHVAVAGMTRVRSDALGADFRNNIFITYFNRHKIVRSILERSGATFVSREEDFLTLDDKDFHPTDVLEDADGSLLVINTGGWFRIGCPVSEIAKPDVLGAIYRVRKIGAPRVADAQNVDNNRHPPQDAAVRLAAVWALARKASPDAHLMLVESLRDEDEGVRVLAARSLGILAGSLGSDLDTQATEHLLPLVVGDTPVVRREAATALGRLCQPRPNAVDGATREKAVTAILESLRKDVTDRMLEHALLYALIRTDSPEAAVKFLRDSNPQVRRGALIALDQMDHGTLTRELVTPLLDTDDPLLRKSALAVISGRKGWATELITLLRTWIAEPELSDDQRALVRGALLAQSTDPAIQQLIGESLAARETPAPTRLVIWETVYRAPVVVLPDSWLAQIERTLKRDDVAETRQVVAIIQDRGTEKFDEALLQIAGNERIAEELRIEAVAATVQRLHALSDRLFVLMTTHLKPDTAPLVLLAAARGLADAPLSNAQLEILAAILPDAGPLAVPVLLRAFSKSVDSGVGLALLTALGRSSVIEQLSADELSAILRKYPSSVQKEAGPLLARLGGSSLDEQQARLKELSQLLDAPGDASRGRELFFGKKAACASCHAVAGDGGRVGPDLSKIGASRSAVDLIEAIAFPSATFAREFRPYVIVTNSGKTFTGVISRQTADAIHLRTADLAEIRVPRSSIDEMKESNTSIMPKGLDTILKPDEFRDLLTYLRELK